MKHGAAPLVSMAAAVGLLTGLRAIASLDLPSLAPLLALDTVPRELYGIRWSAFAVWPADAQSAAFDRLVSTVAALVLAAAAMATLNAVILLAEASATRRGELAIRSAVGASPRVLAMRLLGELRTLVAGGIGLGILLGVSAGAAARIAWPDATVPLSALPADLVGAVLVVLVLLAAAHLTGAWHDTGSGTLVAALRTGARATADPAAVFIRNALAATHITLAATVAIAALALTFAPRDAAVGRPGPGRTSDEPWVLDVAAPSPASAGPDWARALSAVRGIPGVEAESLAAPGALLGLGIRDIAIAECGACMRGIFPAPLWNTTAEHYVVAPGYFAVDGVRLLEGRDFTDGDDAASEPVAIVNRALAFSSFEGGRPLGRRIRIGSDVDGWYRVIGVVDARPYPGLGSQTTVREQVFLSALQRPPDRGAILLRGDESAAQEASTVLMRTGFVASEPVPLGRYRGHQARALSWSRVVTLLTSLLAVALGLVGIAEVAAQTTRRQSGELAVRAALGSPGWRLVAHVLRGRLRVSLWGVGGFVFLGTLAVALLEGAGVAGPGLAGFMTVGAAAAMAAMAASARAARAVARVEPATLLE